MLSYTYDEREWEIRAVPEGNDTEFVIRALSGDQGAVNEKLDKVRRYFESDDDLTDVFFYVYKGGEYRFIVKKEYTDDFILMLMKHRVLLSVSWR